MVEFKKVHYLLEDSTLEQMKKALAFHNGLLQKNFRPKTNVLFQDDDIRKINDD